MFAYDAHKTGAINELRIQLLYSKNGYDVFIPTHPKTRADFIAVKGTEVIRVQVKTAQYNGPYIQSRLDIGGVRYTAEDCDVIVFVLDEWAWIAPIAELAGRPSVCLGKVGDPSYVPRKDYNPENWKVTL